MLNRVDTHKNNNMSNKQKNDSAACPVPPWLEDVPDSAYGEMVNDSVRYLFADTNILGGGSDKASDSDSSMQGIDGFFEEERMSEYREKHSRHGGRRAKQRMHVPDQDDIEMVEEVTKDSKFDKLYDFQATELNMSKVLAGDTIKTTQLERKQLERMENAVIDKFNGINIADNQADVPRPHLMDYSDDHDGEEGDNDENNKYLMYDVHLKCRLCRHTAIRSLDMDPLLYDAYLSMVELQYEKITYASDAVIFKEMCVLFNAQQMEIKEKGGTYFFITTEEVRNHFKYHDTSNPLRKLNELSREVHEVRCTAAKYLFGKIDGRNMWNERKTKSYIQLVKLEQSLTMNMAEVRHRMNTTDTHHLKGVSTSIKKTSAPQKSRHLTGVQKVGRFSSNYVT